MKREGQQQHLTLIERRVMKGGLSLVSARHA